VVAGIAPTWRSFLDRVVAMGYRLVVTEFDVRDRGLAAAIPQRDRDVAAFARAYLDIMLSYPQLNDLLCWGLTDRYSWLRSFEPRPDGQATRGLPYDADFRAKPLYVALRDALAAAPVRPPRPART
jgi:endo-1,4-beta-xylanase